jgi:surface antigen
MLPAATLVGCATVQENPRTATGAGVGAVGGAVLGAAIGSAWGRAGTGAIIGGLTGVLAGGLVGSYYDRQDRARAATAAAYNYNPSSGTLLRIEQVQVTPQSVYPGQSVDLMVTYAVVDPNPQRTVRVTEIREIRQNGNIVGNPSVTVDRQGGTYSSRVPLTIPSNSSPGTYSVITRVQAGTASDAVSTQFTVAARRRY